MTLTRDSVTLYCQPGCAKSKHVRRWLDDLDAFDVIEVDATSDRDAQTFLTDRGFLAQAAKLATPGTTPPMREQP